MENIFSLKSEILNIYSLVAEDKPVGCYIRGFAPVELKIVVKRVRNSFIISHTTQTRNIFYRKLDLYSH